MTPRNGRTPAFGSQIPVRAPSEAPAAWTKPARRLSQLIEQALQSGDPSSATIAAIEGAWAVWEIAHTNPAAVSRVAHLVDRAYVAMHQGRGPQSQDALTGCANILYNGLPSSVRRATDYPKVVELVRNLEGERQLWTAVVKTTSELLGWGAIGFKHAGHVIRVAMASEAEPLP